MLAGKGVTAWRAAVAGLIPAGASPVPACPASGTSPAATATLPARLASELINVLAAVALAGTAAPGPSP